MSTRPEMKLAITIFLLFLTLLFLLYIYNKQNTDWLVVKKADMEVSMGSGGSPINNEIESYKRKEIIERAKEINEKNSKCKYMSSVFLALISVFTIIYTTMFGVKFRKHEEIGFFLNKILSVTIAILASTYVYLTTEIDKLNLCETVLFYEDLLLSNKEKMVGLSENEVKSIIFNSSKRIESCRRN